ncbi:hypothetical protein BJF78_08270 [Pseudonocardia sp. CNS-139]|nr:hypothetical protein BJF78_08270 [Pseudonocardia sp. CNS-139]
MLPGHPKLDQLLDVVVLPLRLSSSEQRLRGRRCLEEPRHDQRVPALDLVGAGQRAPDLDVPDVLHAALDRGSGLVADDAARPRPRNAVAIPQLLRRCGDLLG